MRNEARHKEVTREGIQQLLSRPNEHRVFAVRQALKAGFPAEEINRLTGIDPWFIRNMGELVEIEMRLRAVPKLADAPVELIREAKRNGFSDAQLGTVWSCTEKDVRARRLALGVKANFKLVDTCAAEFEAYTPYFYSTYDDEDEAVARLSNKKKIMILGGGPNRIGQGIEFDYCCCHAAFAMKELGYESIMVNSNPETVSTDYDTSDLLFFEPLTFEDVMNIYDTVKPDGVIVQYGGQTPLNLARRLHDAGVKIIGTSVESIEAAEDRQLFNALIDRLKFNQAPGGTAVNAPTRRSRSRRASATRCWCGRVMCSAAARWKSATIRRSCCRMLKRRSKPEPDAPVLIDKFLEDALEVDVDAVLRWTRRAGRGRARAYRGSRHAFR